MRETQSAIADTLLPELSEREEDAYRLGRNHHASGKPKNATMAEYSRSTGLEAVFGYLHITGNAERIRELFDKAYKNLLKDLEKSL